jgi:hypothetical protein
VTRRALPARADRARRSVAIHWIADDFATVNRPDRSDPFDDNAFLPLD